MNDVVLRVMGGLLVLLALGCGYFILVEVALWLRELTGSRRMARRGETGMRKKGDTGPLRRTWTDTTGAEWDLPAPQPIQPLRDADVVRQLIAHFEEGESSKEPGTE